MFFATLVLALGSLESLEAENRRLASRVESLEQQVRTLMAHLQPAVPASHLEEVHKPAQVDKRERVEDRESRTALSAVLKGRASNEPVEDKTNPLASTAYSDDPAHAFFSVEEFHTSCLRRVDVVCEMTYSGMQLWNKCHSPQADPCKALMKDSALLWVSGDPVRHAKEQEASQQEQEEGAYPPSGAAALVLSVVALLH